MNRKGKKLARNRMRQDNSDGELTAEHEEPVKKPVESPGNITAKRTGTAESIEPASAKKKTRKTKALTAASGDEVTSSDTQSRPETAVTIEREVTGRVCVLNFFEAQQRTAAASENQVNETSLMPITPVVETSRVSITPALEAPASVTEVSDAELARLKQAEERNIKMKTLQLKLGLLKLNLQTSPSSAAEPDPEPDPELDLEPEEQQLELSELQENAALFSEFLGDFKTIKSGPVVWLERVMKEYIGYKEKIKSVKEANSNILKL